MQTKMTLKEEIMPLLKGNDGPIVRSSCSQTALLKNNDAQATKRKLIFACTLAFFFFITEVTAGYLANSLGRICCGVGGQGTDFFFLFSFQLSLVMGSICYRM
jgi:hypothetical protein